MPRGGRVLTMCRGCCSPVARQLLARRGALRLLCRYRFEEGLELLSHSPLLEGGRLRAAAQQHDRRGQVLRYPPEEWRDVTFGADVSVDIRALTGASAAFTRTPLSRRCQSTGSGLLGGGTTIMLFVVSFAVLLFAPGPAAGHVAELAAGCRACGPLRAPSRGWPAPRRAGAWPRQASQGVPYAGCRWRDGVAPAPLH
jgi:hypothetical protein